MKNKNKTDWVEKLFPFIAIPMFLGIMFINMYVDAWFMSVRMNWFGF